MSVAANRVSPAPQGDGAPEPVVQRPCPKVQGYPLIGILPQLLKDPPKVLARIAYEHPGEIVSVPMGPMNVYLVTNPSHVEHVLHTGWRNYGKRAAMWRTLRVLLGNGLVTSEGPTWVRSRRLLNPIFNQKNLAAQVPGMIATIDRILGEMATVSAAGKPFEMLREMTVLTQNVILESVFGVVIDRAEAEFLAATLAGAMRVMNVHMFLSFLPEGFPLPGGRSLKKAIKTIDESLLALSRRWETAGGGDGRPRLLELLEKAVDAETGEGLSPQQIRDELVTLWSAGNESTALTMTWLFYLLNKHPEVEARVRAEIAEVIGDREPTYADMERLRYCKRVLLEQLRLYPASWIIPRQSIEDATVGGYFIPAGSTIIISQYITQHSPELWEKPEEFDPDRFLPERTAGRHPYAYMPFGGGPRRCIGESFGTIEAMLILVRTIQRFRPQMEPGHPPITPRSVGTLHPSGPVMMRLERV